MTEKNVIIDGLPTSLQVERDGPRFAAGDLSLEIAGLDAGMATIRTGGRTYVVPFAVDGANVSFSFAGEIYTAEITDRGARSRARHRDASMSAPMPGLVLRINVESGAVVEKGAPLVILEAMKMEHTIVAPHAGRVLAIHCREGELVQSGVELIELAPSEED